MTKTKYDLISEDPRVNLSKTYPYNILLYMGYLNKNNVESFSPTLIKLDMEKVLNKDELRVLEFRYKDNLTFKEIGKKLDIGSERARDIHFRAIFDLYSRSDRYMRIDTYIATIASDYEIHKLQEEINERKNSYNSNIYNPESILLNTKISDIGLSTRAVNCLQSYRYLDKIVTVREMVDIVNNDFKSFLNIKNLGRKTAKEILTFLDDNGLLIGEEAKEFLKR